MKKIADFIIYGNLLISICAACFIWETYTLLNLSVNPLCIAVGFAATLFTYNVDRLAVMDSLSKTGSERHNWIVQFRRGIIAMMVPAFLFAAGSVFFMPLRCLFFIGHLGIISVLYSVPALIRGKRGLRSVKLLKIFLITYVWAAATVLLPVIWEGSSIFQPNVMLLFAERVLFIFAITLPFDIRDYRSDKFNNILTIPGLIGIRRTRAIAFVCILVFFMINLLHYDLHSGTLLAKLLSGFEAGAVIYYAKENRHEYYYTGLLDSTMIVQFVLVLMLR